MRLAVPSPATCSVRGRSSRRTRCSSPQPN